jgi:hypothetical protein
MYAYPDQSRVLLQVPIPLLNPPDLAEDDETDDKGDDSNTSDDDGSNATSGDVVAVLLFVHPISTVVPVIADQVLCDATSRAVRLAGKLIRTTGD